MYQSFPNLHLPFPTSSNLCGSASKKISLLSSPTKSWGKGGLMLGKWCPQISMLGHPKFRQKNPPVSPGTVGFWVAQLGSRRAEALGHSVFLGDFFVGVGPTKTSSNWRKHDMNNMRTSPEFHQQGMKDFLRNTLKKTAAAGFWGFIAVEDPTKKSCDELLILDHSLELRSWNPKTPCETRHD